MRPDPRKSQAEDGKASFGLTASHRISPTMPEPKSRASTSRTGRYVIEGNMTETNSAKDICPYIWTSAGAQKVAETTLCQGVGLAVAGNDIYVAGNENAGYDSEYNQINIAYLWKNGVEQELEVEYKNDFSLWGVICAYVEKK